jgi:serine/threonine protein kinase
MDQLAGKIIANRYHVRELIGEGGMADIYRATDYEREHDVALKLLKTRYQWNDQLEMWLQQEAEALQAMDHNHVVRYFGFEFDHKSGLSFIVMSYIDGPSLKAFIRDNPSGMSVEDIINIIDPVSRALSYIHRKQRVHRDIKPANILIAKDTGSVFLTDLGISAYKGQELQGKMRGSGTPAYMSPEQVANLSADHRSDIYSLAVVVYEMLTGRPVFVGDSPEAHQQTSVTHHRVYWEHQYIPPLPPSTFRPDLTSDIDAILLRALSKDPDDRYSDVRHFVQDLLQALGAEPTHNTDSSIELPPEPKSRNPLVFIAAALVIIGVLLGGLLIANPPESSEEATATSPSVGSLSVTSTRAAITTPGITSTRRPAKTAEAIQVIDASTATGLPPTSTVLPSATTIPPTNTPLPTATLLPTETTMPLTATATFTFVPTDVPETSAPTVTLITSAATSTRIPSTETPVPTVTPLPTATPTLPTFFIYVRTNGDNARVRRTPSINRNNIVDSVENNSRVEVVATNSNRTWVKILYDRSKSGWIAADLTNISRSDLSQLPTEDR